jgi:hypothetical protein
MMHMSCHIDLVDKPGLFDRSSLPLQEGTQQTLAKLLLKRPGNHHLPISYSSCYLTLILQ